MRTRPPTRSGTCRRRQYRASLPRLRSAAPPGRRSRPALAWAAACAARGLLGEHLVQRGAVRHRAVAALLLRVRARGVVLLRGRRCRRAARGTASAPHCMISENTGAGCDRSVLVGGFVEHDDRREPRVPARARTRRTTPSSPTCTRLAARPCATYRSCPRPCSRGSTRTRRCRCAPLRRASGSSSSRSSARPPAARACRAIGCRSPCSSIVASRRRGGTVTPPFAIVAYTSSICIAVTATP